MSQISLSPFNLLYAYVMLDTGCFMFYISLLLNVYRFAFSRAVAMLTFSTEPSVPFGSFISFTFGSFAALTFGAVVSLPFG